MNLLVPLVSLVGPIYFAARGFSLEFVLVWAAVWTGVRFLATWKQVFAVLNEGDESPSWYPLFAFAGAFVATLAMFEAAHVAVYFMICRLIQISN
ncbi:hypothetical protein [Mesorhizobium sp. B1-1-5]|uniref:hypothetical protein n=1 Tax=Mesorhizobium sp. B1-1-5 TaxID=2589979 RepID=UPI00112B5545|nr:hypothetical protein [Mesorhizobium sp. B1-1-5]TPO09835.1 hypothetical protein FJ980_09885 [Mesorhizobium sp. B1-1-5]